MSFLPKDKYQIRETFATAAMIGVGYALIPNNPDVVNNGLTAFLIAAFPYELDRINTTPQENEFADENTISILDKIRHLSKKAGLKTLNITSSDEPTFANSLTNTINLNKDEYNQKFLLHEEKEKLAVVGHEIGHLVHKDSQKQVLKLKLLCTAIAAHVLESNFNVDNAFNIYLGIGMYSLINKYAARQQEFAADKYGSELIGDAKPLIGFFQKRADSHEEENKKKSLLVRTFLAITHPINQLHSTHPTHKQRIRALESLKLNND